MDRYGAFSNMLWRFMERIGAKSISFFVSVVLARMLSPEDYGLVALVSVIIVILDVFIDSGFGTALIQKKDSDEIDYSSVFYFNIVLSVVLYGMVFISAPFLAGLFQEPELAAIIRVMSLVIIVSGVKNVQQAYVSQHMLFKKFFFSTIGGTLFSGVFGIFLAYKGYGIWALVLQNLSNIVIDTIILWITVEWKPKKCFSVSRLKKLFGYSGRYMFSVMIARVSDQISQPVIGVLYSKADLAYYNQGSKISNIVAENINSAMESVLFPALSNVQDERGQVRQITKRFLQVSTYMMAPAMIGVAACGKSVVEILFTEKWNPCVPYLFVFCIMYSIYPLHIANINVPKALGVSEIFIKLQMIKSIISMIVLLVCLPFGVFAIAVGTFGTSVVSLIINAWPNNKLIGYSLIEQIKDILPILLLTVAMGGIVYSVNFWGLSSYLTLPIQVFVGIAVYIGGSNLLRIESYEYVKDLITIFMKKEH